MTLNGGGLGIVTCEEPSIGVVVVLLMKSLSAPGMLAKLPRNERILRNVMGYDGTRSEIA